MCDTVGITALKLMLKISNFTNFTKVIAYHIFKYPSTLVHNFQCCIKFIVVHK